MLLSPHFSLEELTRTDTGLSNDPEVEQGEALVILADTILEPMRDLVGPLRVNSGFRSKAVNDRIGGAKNSQHMAGQAADVVPLKCGLERAFQAVKSSSIPYDQLIIEPTWIHVSWSKNPRRQTLRAHIEGGRMVYEVA
jgi:zinc D-Ala-D-Ala carboxypeptidase